MLQFARHGAIWISRCPGGCGGTGYVDGRAPLLGCTADVNDPGDAIEAAMQRAELAQDAEADTHRGETP